MYLYTQYTEKEELCCMKYFSLIYLCVVAFWAHAQVPRVGQTGKTEIACWNIEWFGSTQFGPTNETLQYSHIKNVLQNSDIDIWGLAEVSNPNTFVSLMNELPQYGYVLAPFSQTQKTALIWKKNLFRRVTSGLILNAYSAEFANGRLPLEVRLVSDSLPKLDTLVIIVLHLKANTGTDAEKLQSYYDRRASSVALKDYMDTQLSNKKVAVIGDWNDRLTTSIWKDSITPFKNILNDPAGYFFTTLARNQNGETTIAGFANSFIDHILVNNTLLRSAYESGSARVFPLNNYITDYANTASDHYPVYAFFNFMPGVGVSAVPEKRVSIYPNPAAGEVFIHTDEQIESVQLTSVTGIQKQVQLWGGLSFHPAAQGVAPGIYIVTVTLKNGLVYREKMVLK
jgi:endonuclease/exonuclease/phosphatase family metal-dependent hydrolase